MFFNSFNFKIVLEFLHKNQWLNIFSIDLLLWSLSLFLFDLVVHLNMLNCKPEWERLSHSEVVILISDMDLLNLVFDSSENSCDKAKKWRLSELLLFLSPFGPQLIFITHRISLFPHLLLMLLLSNHLPFFRSHGFSL